MAAYSHPVRADCKSNVLFVLSAFEGFYALGHPTIRIQLRCGRTDPIAWRTRDANEAGFGGIGPAMVQFHTPDGARA